MGRIDLNKVLGYLSVSLCSNSCMCMSTLEDQDGLERKPLMDSEEMVKLRGMFEGNRTLAFHLEPKTVVLRVSMHCHGCARKVGKHISKMEGVTSFEVDLESKKVVVMGDITPFEVLESVSKVKSAELWIAP
uniref:Copper transport protein ATOX1 n=1 Tax=Anthurium amnicola TaxID=1678845 RepID=A0A1D1XH21_9ARAE